MKEQQKQNIKVLITFTNEQVEQQYADTAATIRKAAVEPFCDKYGLTFKQRMKAFVFTFKEETKKHIKLYFGNTSTISEEDAELLGEEFIKELEEVSDLIYEKFGERNIFEYMEDYPDGD